ncbi:GNAT family N-acetyltransferase [Rhizobium sp. P32RR-XVIII]|uniref:GNAT family N-acetyltransferase n=1 Tax=Rhizobium sp. P32RR-XVIII TaxID=2726738 RepID=UPI001456560E|nr:GNAT family N-acetyltransferase [Rhizobium sp. P32RR-XVIII]NLS02154.1 GNAT family N-acetyltransferase [Rhizobium sp. P32RR-XVIII]
MTTPIYQLRPSVETDYDAIAEVWHGSASLPDVGPPVMPTLNELRERVDLAFAAGWEVTLAARERDVIGFVAIKPREAILDQLFVRPGYLGCGIGQALLGHAMAKMPEGFTLFTASRNTRARAFYEKAGLIFLRDAPHPRTGHPVTYYGWTGR